MAGENPGTSREFQNENPEESVRTEDPEEPPERAAPPEIGDPFASVSTD